jgi:hypothetical protein
MLCFMTEHASRLIDYLTIEVQRVFISINSIFLINGKYVLLICPLIFKLKRRFTSLEESAILSSATSCSSLKMRNWRQASFCSAVGTAGAGRGAGARTTDLTVILAASGLVVGGGSEGAGAPSQEKIKSKRRIRIFLLVVMDSSK